MTFLFSVLNDLIDDMAKKLQDHHHIEEFANVAFPAQVTISLIDCCKYLNTVYCSTCIHGYLEMVNLCIKS